MFFTLTPAMLKNTHLILLAAALLFGCAHAQNIRTTGEIGNARLQGRSFAIDGDSGAAGQVAEALKSAGMKQGEKGRADFIMTVAREERPVTRRFHTGGKNGVAYDRTTNGPVLTLTVTAASSPAVPIFTATAENEDVGAFASAAVAAMKRE